MKLTKLRKNYSDFMTKLGKGENINEMLQKYVIDVETIKNENMEIEKYCQKIEEKSKDNLKKIGLVRYNAYKNTGSDLSFALAILNEKDTSGSSDKWRGSTHGQAMKDACELDFKGTSNHAASNGFSLQLPGFGDKSTAYGFGQEGMYWTSSIAHGEAAYGRKFGTDGGVYRNDVYRYRPYRYYQFSVRCKKD